MYGYSYIFNVTVWVRVCGCGLIGASFDLSGGSPHQLQHHTHNQHLLFQRCTKKGETQNMASAGIEVVGGCRFLLVGEYIGFLWPHAGYT